MPQIEDSDLGSALGQLSDVADGYSENLQQLNEAVTDLQESTAQLGNKQAAASKALSKAATQLSPAHERPAAGGHESGHTAVADD